MITDTPTANARSDKQSHVATSHSPACFPYTSPVHLRAAAFLYGISGVPLEKARVLELGCDVGGNLLPFVLAYPDAQAVGIDLWPERIKIGQEAISGMGVKNLQLHAMSYLEIDHTLGEFDYIIVHDVFTWSPTDVRAAILRICQENLSAQGIAYISHNTYPGWKAGDILRDAMQLHTHGAQSMEEALTGASGILPLMSDGLSAGNQDKTELRAAVDRMLRHPDYYINSDFLQATSAASYFVEFASAAEQAGLAYVGDALPQDEISSTFGLNVQLNHSLTAIGQPKIMRQQYLDFASGRSFRRSLFVKQDQEANIASIPDLERLAGLRWAANYQWVKDERKTTISEAIFMNPRGARLELDNPYAIQIMSVLDSAWPASLSYENLIFHTQHIDVNCADKQEQAKAVRQALESLFKKNALRYSLGPGPYDDIKNTEFRMLPELAAQLKVEQSTQGSTTFNLWHDTISLRLNDKQRELLSQFGENIEVGELAQHLAKESTRAVLIPLINILKRHGALLAGTEAWVLYYSTLLKTDETKTDQLVGAVGPINLYGNGAQQGGAGKSKVAHKAFENGQGFHQGCKGPTPQEINRTVQLRKSQDFAEAAKQAARLTKAYPAHAIGWELASILASDEQRLDEALQFVLKAVALAPDTSRPYSQLSSVLCAMNMQLEARINATRALDINPRNEDGWNNLGNHFRGCTLPAQALRCYKKMVEVAPTSTVAYSNLANTLGDVGYIKEAVVWNEKALAAEPNNFTTYSNHLFTLSQLPGIDAQRFFEAHKEYGRRVERTIKHIPRPPHTNINEPDRKLRIGFVSGDLRNHAVASFIEPIWQFIDKSAFELYAYSASAEDFVSKRLKNHVTQWVSAASLNNQALAARIRHDGIDILVDLSGHTAMNRLPMFALRPAPVQASWIGYPATTGLTAMDYYLSDKDFVPPGEFENQFTEKLAWMPFSAPFQPVPDSPNVNALPALTNEYFTFGSFNRISKINDEVYAQWARILHAVPDSKFLMGNVYDGIRQDIINGFEQNGITANRLIIHDRTSMKQYLHLHHRVDMLLDTFPYSGGTTTMHALWMGVPTLTLSGAITPSRTTASFLPKIGLHEFVAETLDEYLETAVAWAENRQKLSSIRLELREKIRSLRSAEDITRAFETALRRMWKVWCKGARPESFHVDEKYTQ